ncbi:NTP transferase domain-containing protein [Magnetofaba australis]|uniref:Putative acylneuraminate cytidylyltransferase n=1 Tax=Magnetofaba australis IT-1 TaxID=1434232 RepID=A0A1Y2K517_9PROT|nr:NTP transferase domain-containing protein [Magnetofaba australis]OSM04802.1 putative acylneuraminate cytidylyltransferase [Magnetofaba australis IT-1]
MNVAVVVPALQSNRYHPEGDLALFGDVTLLEWKLSQLREAFPLDHIYLSCPQQRVAQLAQFSLSKQVNLVQRPEGQSFLDFIASVCRMAPQENLMVAPPITPFMGADIYRRVLEAFANLGSEHDSVVTAVELREYIYDSQGKPVNFSSLVSRQEISPVFQVVNGCYLTPKETLLRNHHQYGERPLFLPVDRLSALEVKTAEDLQMARALLPNHIQTRL